MTTITVRTVFPKSKAFEKEGQTVKKPGNVVLYHKLLAKKAGHVLELGDEAILQVVDSIPGDDKAAEDNRIAALLAAQDKLTEPDADDTEEEADATGEDAAVETTSIALAGEKRGFDEAAVLVADTEAVGMLREIVDSNETVKTKPASFMLRVLKDYGCDIDWSANGGKLVNAGKMNIFPEPGTVERKDANGRRYVARIMGTGKTKQELALPNSENLPADIYVTEVIRPDGQSGPGNASWIKNFASRLSIYKEADEQYNAAQKKKETDVLGSAQDVALWAARRNSVLNVVRNAIWAYLTIAGVFEHCPGVNLNLAWDDVEKTKLRRTTKQVFLQNRNDQTKFVAYSLGQLLLLDPVKAGENGGTYLALLATAKRQPKGGTQPQSDAVKIENFARLDTVLGAVGTWLDNEENKTALFRELKKKDKDGEYVNGHLIEACIDLRAELAPIEEAYRPWYDRKQLAQSQKDTQKKQQAA